MRFAAGEGGGGRREELTIRSYEFKELNNTAHLGDKGTGRIFQ